MNPSPRRVAVRFLTSTDPFESMDPSMHEAFRDFTYRLMMWMGMADPIHLKWILKVWKSSRLLRDWLTRNVNRGVSPLWYGGQFPPGTLPTVGEAHDRRYPVVQWSKDRRVAEWFAGIRDDMSSSDPRWGGGFLVQAEAGSNQVIVDIDVFSALVGRHRNGFQSIVQQGDARAMFVEGEQREGEVLTLPVSGKIVAVKAW